MKRIAILSAQILLSATVICATAAAQATLDESSAISRDLRLKGRVRLIVEFGPDAIRGAPAAAAYLRSALSGTDAPVTAINEKIAVVSATQEAFEKLKQDRGIINIIQDIHLPPALADAVPLIGGKEVWAKGFDGKGVAVAVLDSGIDAQHPFFAGKIVKQACFSVEDETVGAKSLCPGGVMQLDGSWVDLSASSATGCPADVFGCLHGTHVAGIVGGIPTQDVGRELAGLAKGAGIIPIQIYSRLDKEEECKPDPAPCAQTFISSQLRALQYVDSMVMTHATSGEGPRIVAVNISVGGGHFGAPCDTGDYAVYARRIKALRDEGVPTFLPSGNQSFPDGVNFPGCISSAITVGAIYKRTNPGEPLRMAEFSNRFEDKLVDLVTFGVDITSAVPGGKFASFKGTSLSSPLAAAAYALLAEAFPKASVDTIEHALKVTGADVLEPVSGKYLKAIQVDRAMAGLIAEAQLERANETNNRFVIEVVPGRAEESAAILQKSQNDIAKELDVVKVDAAANGNDAVNVRTSRPVNATSLKNALRLYLGNDIWNLTTDKRMSPQ